MIVMITVWETWIGGKGLDKWFRENYFVGLWKNAWQPQEVDLMVWELILLWWEEMNTGFFYRKLKPLTIMTGWVVMLKARILLQGHTDCHLT